MTSHRRASGADTPAKRSPHALRVIVGMSSTLKKSTVTTANTHAAVRGEHLSCALAVAVRRAHLFGLTGPDHDLEDGVRKRTHSREGVEVD